MLLLLLKKKKNQIALLSLLLKEKKKRSKKRKHRFWVHAINTRRQEQGAYHNLVRELELDANRYQQYFRMSAAKMDYLLDLVGPALTKKTVIREPLPPKLKLAVCIRYVSTAFFSKKIF